METKALNNIFISLLRSDLTEKELEVTVKEQLTSDTVAALYPLSKEQDVSHIIASSLLKNKVVTDAELIAKLKKEELMSVYRHEQMKYAYNQICSIFDSLSIPYIPLKGSVLRMYYPKESMRTSCDIDILIKEEFLKSAINGLTAKGFKRGDRKFHDVSLYSPNNIHLELHFNIMEKEERLDNVLKNPWQYALPAEGCRYVFCEEFFIFHIFAHLSHHFINGGCGIRSLMDVWVMKNKMGITYDKAMDLLEKAGIYRFAAEISNLADSCFSGKEKDEFFDTLLTYIINGGLYGTPQNITAVKKEKSKSTFRYTMQRLFMPYGMMSEIYPILKKIPIILPFCWIIRIIKMLFGGKLRKSISEVKAFGSVSDSEVERIEYINEKLGL